MQDISKKLDENLRKVSKGASVRLLEISKDYISNIENGKKNPTLITIQKLADALGMAADKLIKQSL